MPTRASRRCTRCGTKTPTSPCPACEDSRRRDAERRRPNFRQRGYRQAHDAFHTAVLARDPWCTCPGCNSCHHSAPRSPCIRSSKHADHHPRTRRELVDDGQDPDDPRHGRGLCHPCHSSHTASRDGGFGNPR